MWYINSALCSCEGLMISENAPGFNCSRHANKPRKQLPDVSPPVTLTHTCVLDPLKPFIQIHRSSSDSILRIPHHVKMIYEKMLWYMIQRADSTIVPSQWETSLQSNAVCHWLGTNLESALRYTEVVQIQYLEFLVMWRWFMKKCFHTWYTGLILGLRPANERQLYFATMSLTGLVQA